MSKENGKETSNQFPIVGIGASAGGLEALKLFLKELPAKSGMAYVFVQHLSPSHESILPEILAKLSPIPVHEITDNIHLQQDNLYIIPENKTLSATDGVLKLSPLDRQHTKSNTIDQFFSSLGSVHQSYAIGIILSGSLRDGTVGLQVIKSYGGLTFAQDEDSATFEGMPGSAAKAGVVDFILPPGEIAKKLVSINYPFQGIESQALTPDNSQEDNDVFKQILTVLRVRRGVDFQYYKSSTLKRRIVRRMALSKIEKPADYLFLLRENKNEQDALYNDMLISVTNFFRDPQSFNVLCSNLFPALLRKKIANESLRIWIAGCATGEEAYSMAMCLQEHLGDKTAVTKIQIFATDISETAIAKARSGVYKANELEGLSTSRIAQFMTKLDGSYQVNKEIRDMCVFAHHNLLKDPPFSKIDLISCRNVLIYLEPVLQKRALTTFHYALNDKGYLMLGKSETVGINTDIFTPYEFGEKIYLKKGDAGTFMNVATQSREQSFRNTDKGIQKEAADRDIFKHADEAMLANFMPAGVLINDKFDIIQFRGTTDMWLASPPGRPSFNILKMARDGLAFELRNLLQMAKKSNVMTRKYGVNFKLNDLQHFVNLHILPLTYASELNYLVVFQPASSTGIQPNMFDTQQAQEDGNYNASEIRIEHLERELIQSRADMRVIAEEQESANEELQSANEELLSSSEELQSLNEEMETSKEELQSTNEEIIIVNKELMDRNDQLNNARMYTEGIVNTIRDPLIIMDRSLNIKRATNGFYTKFRLTEKETEGTYLYELNNGLWNIAKLKELLDSDLPKKKFSGDIEIEQTFPALGRKIMLVNARLLDNMNGERLVILALEDITDKRKVEQGLAEAKTLLEESADKYKFAVEAAGICTWDYNPQTRELEWDERCRDLFGIVNDAEVSYQDFLELIVPEDRGRTDQVIESTLRGAGNGMLDISYRIIVNQTEKTIRAKGKVFFSKDGIALRLNGTAIEVKA